MKRDRICKTKIRLFRLALFILVMIWQNQAIEAQINAVEVKNFQEVVAKRLSGFKKITNVKGKNVETELLLKDVCGIDTDSVAKRVFAEYGAIFAADNDIYYPTTCIFENENDVQVYQNNTKSKTTVIGGTSITLQLPAMEALEKAIKEAAKENLQITPRGGSIAAKRSYQDTAKLWNSRFLPALKHWVEKGEITRAEAEAAKKLPIRQQVAKVLNWETNGLYFSKDLTKSILYSVAAPGASQHIFMLALDVEQFDNAKVRDILAKYGWFQTVKSDFPHFTYLGVKEGNLARLGIKTVLINGYKFRLPNL